MYAYTQYLFGVAIVATVDLDAPDAHLINPDHEAHSKWLVKNTVRVELPRGETFFDADRRPRRRVPNEFSLFCTDCETPPRTVRCLVVTASGV